MPTTGTCNIAGCARDVAVRGLCTAHYHRDYRGGPTGRAPWRISNRCGWCAVDIRDKVITAKYCSATCRDAIRTIDKVAIAIKHAKRRKRTPPMSCLTPVNLNAVKEASNHRCVYCGSAGAHFDHFVPVSRGGANCAGNLVWACSKCNHAKHAKMPTEWGPASDITPVLCPAGHPEGPQRL
jgi:5-methylcytosine-specific restriction endonuclease McrA